MNVFASFSSRYGFQGLIASATLASIFLAGGLRELGIGLFFLTCGAVLLRCRPTGSVSPLLWIVGAGIVLCGFPPVFVPADAVTSGILSSLVPGHSGPWQLSVEPLTSGFWALVLMASVFLGLFLLSSPPSDDRLRAVAPLMVAGCLAYGLLSLMIWKSGWVSPFWLKEAGSENTFGLFPNRNHTAGFLLTGAILAAGVLVDVLARGRIAPAILAAVSLPVLASLLLACSRSRAGLIFFVAGLVIWFAGLGKRRPRWLTVGSVFFAIVLVVLFATSGGPLLKRLLSTDPSEGGGGPRIEIAKDALGMISTAPLTGHGMGTFPLLYPWQAKHSLRYATTALHPESDWLLILHDDGIVAAVLALLALLFCFFRMPRGLDTSEVWPLRWALASAFLAEILHSVIDVPLHRVELGWWVLLLGGFSASGWLAKGSALRWQVVVFKLGGLLFLGLGCWLILSVVRIVSPPPPFESLQSREKILKLYGVVSYGEAGPVLAECERLLAKYPFNTELAHQYATFLIQEKTDPDRSRALFAMERKLLPHDGDIVFQQGWILIDENPSETVSLWKEALARQSSMDSLPGNPVSRLTELFRSMMQVASEHPSMAGRMGVVASAFPSTRLAWISNSSCPVTELESAARDQAFMAALTPSQRGRVYEAIWERGDRGVLRKILETSSSGPETLPIRARFLAESGKAEEACRLIVNAYAIPLPHPPGVSQDIRPAGNDIPKDPLEAARYYLGIGNSIAARRYLEEARGASSGAPGEFYLLAANVAMDDGKWPEALQMLLAFLDATGKR